MYLLYLLLLYSISNYFQVRMRKWPVSGRVGLALIILGPKSHPFNFPILKFPSGNFPCPELPIPCRQSH